MKPPFFMEAERYAELYPLHYAVANGNVNEVLRLLEEDADVNAEDNDTRTPRYFVLESRYDIENKEKIDSLLSKYGGIGRKQIFKVSR